MHYEVASSFLENIYKNSGLGIYNKNVYVDELDNLLRTDYLDTLLGLSSVSYRQIIGIGYVILRKVICSLRSLRERLCRIACRGRERFEGEAERDQKSKSEKKSK